MESLLNVINHEKERKGRKGKGKEEVKLYLQTV